MKEITNKPIPEIYKNLYDEKIKGESLFVIVGDLKLKGKYGESMLVFTKDKLYAFDSCFSDNLLIVEYKEIEEAEVKRMYGNAFFKVKLKGENKKKNILRFSYAAAEVGDAAANFVNVINENGFSEAEVEVVKSVYSKQRSFCPKCGRKLPKPDAECINCSSKSHIISKFAKYVAPEKTSLVVCMLLSVVATVLSLVPPYITKIMVDDVIPNKNSQKLIVVLVWLMGVYVFQYIVNGIRSYKLRITGNKLPLT